jgi:hypothetical protein
MRPNVIIRVAVFYGRFHYCSFLRRLAKLWHGASPRLACLQQWICHATILSTHGTLHNTTILPGTRGSVAIKALYYKPEGRGFDSRWGEFLNLLILPVALGPGVYSASNRNEYQKH